ncbi:recombination regulator RecX [Ornithinibacillus bavariensis]|uniref:Regulatory protein RecX n=1 Tax=Ornithinibacillus bavariensis TaxID=545502 RepID=A0A919XA45_9BACI|nr:recombination regulator RecX [Ornithinibacillus bavariensis]GIO27854.1 regulatory protein RecX [Ornithinibacillus bavariensis]HAM80369.1 recombination regulator RecX [Ornithinibacillus sp.]
MPAKISRITTQKKSKQRYNVYLVEGDSDAYGFSVDEAILVEFGLRKGLELDEATIEQLIKQDTIQKSYLLAINYLSYRMRSRKEMYDYLKQKEVEEEHIAVIMERLTKEGLLNDQQFAEAFTLTRINTSSKGPLLVKRELMDKGVSAVIADEAIALYTYDTQFEKAMKWVNKKIGTSKKESYKKQLQQLQMTLIQKGFEQPVISDVIMQLRNQANDTDEWEALVYQGDKLLRKYEGKKFGYELKMKVKEGLYRKGFHMELINQFIDEIEDRV